MVHPGQRRAGAPCLVVQGHIGEPRGLNSLVQRAGRVLGHPAAGLGDPLQLGLSLGVGLSGCHLLGQIGIAVGKFHHCAQGDPHGAQILLLGEVLHVAERAQALDGLVDLLIQAQHALLQHFAKVR